MSHVQDIVVFAIVLACVIYATRTLLPKTVLARITGNGALLKKSGGCGSCDGCATNKGKTDSSCH